MFSDEPATDKDRSTMVKKRKRAPRLRNQTRRFFLELIVVRLRATTVTKTIWEIWRSATYRIRNTYVAP